MPGQPELKPMVAPRPVDPDNFDAPALSAPPDSPALERRIPLIKRSGGPRPTSTTVVIHRPVINHKRCQRPATSFAPKWPRWKRQEFGTCRIFGHMRNKPGLPRSRLTSA